MNRHEAQALLEMYRPGGQDAADPRFAEALEYLKRDPELARWFERQRAFDTALSESLKTIHVPEHLQAAILAGIPKSASAESAAAPGWWQAVAAWLNRPLIPERRILASPWWQNWKTRTAVVCGFTALALAGGFLLTREPDTFARFRTEIVENSWEGGKHLELVSSDAGQVQDWVAQQEIAGSFALPDALSGTQLRGARLIEWRGRKVGLICLLDGSKHLHLFVMDHTEFPDTPTGIQPQFEKCEGWRTVSWTQGQTTFILAGMKYYAFMKRFRKGGHWVFSS